MQLFIVGCNKKCSALAISVSSGEIASCLEKAYDKIALTEAGRMLFFESEKLVRDYAKEVRVVVA
jgi:hypothetical protein